MKKKLLFLLAFSIVGSLAYAQDWSGIPVPADAGAGKTWQLQSNVSDDFNYSSTAGNRPAAFTSKWVDTYHNAWTGPGATLWNKDQCWHNGSQMAIQARPAPGGKSYNGIVTSKNYIQYPIYMEIKAKIMDQVLANAFWTLTDDDTQEIDIMEGYGSSREAWFAHRMHVSHHVFIRNPFTDYQPMDAGSWVYNATPWRADYHRYGCYWKDPWTLEYYIDGVHVRTVSGKNMIDPNNHTNGTGLNKKTKIIIDCENQTDWRPAATEAELSDDSKNIFWVDWVRFYKPVDNNNGGGDTGGGDTGGGSGSCNLPYTNSGFTITKQTKNWSSGVIDISCASSVDVSMKIKGVGPMENADYLRVYYKLNGGAKTAISTNTNAFNEKTISANNKSGNTIEIIVEGKTSWGDETYTVSNISITSDGSSGGGDTGGGDTGGGTGAVITIQAESFTTTSGTYNDAHAGGPGLGANKTGSTINYVNNGDYMDYNVTIPEDGAYEIVYYISSPITGSTIQFGIPGTVFNTTTVPNNGAWDSYKALKASNTANFTKGNHIVRLTAGAQTWTWNLDKFTLQRVSAMKSANDITYSEIAGSQLYPNPAIDELNVQIFAELNDNARLIVYNSLGKVVITQQLSNNYSQIAINSLSPGIYVAQIINGENIENKKFIKE